MKNSAKAVVLFSGGLDSTTVLAYAKNSGFEVYALSFNYGQRNISELNYAAATAKLLNVNHKIAKIDFSFLQGISSSSLLNHNSKMEECSEVAAGTIPNSYVPARNLMLLSHAISYGESLGAFTIFIGANIVDYGNYPDCRPEFLEQVAIAANLGTTAVNIGSKFEIKAPLLMLSKADIIKLGISLKVNYSSTLSCYNPDLAGRPCTICLSCSFRKNGFEEAGLKDEFISFSDL